MHEVVLALTILYLALEVLESLLFANEILEFIGRRHLHNDVRPSAAIHFLILEDISYMARLDVHLQRTFVLVDDDS